MGEDRRCACPKGMGVRMHLGGAHLVGMYQLGVHFQFLPNPLFFNDGRDDALYFMF